MAFLLESHTFYRENDSDGWGLADFVTYVTVNETANPELVGKKFDKLIANFADDNSDASVFKWKTGLQPIEDIHLKSGYARDPVSNNGNIRNVRFFSIIAIFILLMAWVNYINLSTARAIRRAREVGIRKSVGAYRQQLMSQFLIESGLVNIGAALLSIGIAFLLLPVLNDITGKELQFKVFQDLQFGNLFSVFSLLAIFIACLGLFALVSFSASLRGREIGIRKVLGAGTRNVMVLLSGEYIALILVAVILAVPAFIWWGRDWLNDYAYNIRMGLDIFLIPVLILITVSFLTVGYRIYVASLANPVDSLKA